MRNPRSIDATVSGFSDGQPFTTKLSFKRIDPNPDEKYYGSGEYISVTFEGRPDLKQFIDNRYDRLSLDEAASRFLNGYFGQNMLESELHFHYDKEDKS